MIQTNFINFLKHARLQKRVWQGHTIFVVEKRFGLIHYLLCINTWCWWDTPCLHIATTHNKSVGRVDLLVYIIIL